MFEINILFPIRQIIHNPFFYNFTIKVKHFTRMSWLITSKAFDRSPKIDKVYLRWFELLLLAHWLSRCKSGWNVQCFTRNPYRCLYRRFGQSENEIIFLCIIVSNILENAGSYLIYSCITCLQNMLVSIFSSVHYICLFIVCISLYFVL